MRDNAFLEYLRMGGRRNSFKQIQGPQNRTYGPMESMKWEDIIFDEKKVTCTVVMKSGTISIRTKDYTDFVLAKSALKGRTKHPIVRDVSHET